MSLKCLLNGLEVNYPCSPTCALFGDCCTAFEAQRKSRVVTNADHIRSLSDEELAWEIRNMSCPPSMDGKVCDIDDCAKCWLDWLKAPYEEDKHGG